MISRNEEQAVKLVIKNIKKYVPGCEIVVVDSSEDKTADIARRMGAKVFRQYPPRGYGPAMEKALFSPKKDIIITLDCDNTYPAETIPQLVDKIKEGYDVVGTSRLAYGKPQHMPWLNYLANYSFNIFASVIFFRRIQDCQTGMRAYRRQVIHDIKWGVKGYVIPGLSLFKSGAKGNSFPVELLLKPISCGYRVTEIPIHYQERLGRSTLQKLNSTLWAFLRIINARLYSIR